MTSNGPYGQRSIRLGGYWTGRKRTWEQEQCIWPITAQLPLHSQVDLPAERKTSHQRDRVLYSAY